MIAIIKHLLTMLTRLYLFMECSQGMLWDYRYKHLRKKRCRQDYSHSLFSVVALLTGESSIAQEACIGFMACYKAKDGMDKFVNCVCFAFSELKLTITYPFYTSLNDYL